MKRMLSRFAVLAMLFSQFALAAYACPMDEPVAAAAIAPAQGDCCDGPEKSPLCAAHCTDGLQAQKPTQSVLADAPLVPLITSQPHFFIVMPSAPPLPVVANAAPPPGPPPAIRNTRLRI
jgi:hypothetical protein